MVNEPVQRRLQFVMDHYGLRPTENVVLNYFAMANEVFTITTEQGKYVLKHCFKNNTKALVENETALIEHLAHHHVLTPEIVLTKSGKPFLQFDNEFYVLTQFVDGYFPTWEDSLTLNMVNESTRALAQFHLATIDFKAPNPCSRIGALEISRASDWVKNLLHTLDAAPSTRKSVDRMKKIGQQMLVLAEQLKIEIDTINLDDLKRTWIHGDMHCFNLIFSDDKQHHLGVLDFDFLREDYRLFDIYWTSRIYNWSYWYKEAFGEKMHDEQFEPPEDLVKDIVAKNFEIMIKTYTSINSIGARELRHLPLFVQTMPLYVVRFFNLNNSEEECLEHCEWFEWKLKTLEQTTAFVRRAVTKVIEKGIVQ